LGLGEGDDGLHPGAEVLPELLDAPRAWKAPAHPDDGDAVELHVATIVTHGFLRSSAVSVAPAPLASAWRAPGCRRHAPPARARPSPARRGSARATRRSDT